MLGGIAIIKTGYFGDTKDYFLPYILAVLHKRGTVVKAACLESQRSRV